jgi:hypothetical protein
MINTCVRLCVDVMCESMLYLCCVRMNNTRVQPCVDVTCESMLYLHCMRTIMATLFMAVHLEAAPSRISCVCVCVSSPQLCTPFCVVHHALNI